MDDIENLDNSGTDESPERSYADGEIISLGGSEVTDSKGRVLTVRYEAELVTGELGRRLELAQAAAIRDVLAYLADKDRESQDDAERDSTS